MFFAVFGIHMKKNDFKITYQELKYYAYVSLFACKKCYFHLTIIDHINYLTVYCAHISLEINLSRMYALSNIVCTFSYT